MTTTTLSPTELIDNILARRGLTEEDREVVERLIATMDEIERMHQQVLTLQAALDTPQEDDH